MKINKLIKFAIIPLLIISLFFNILFMIYIFRNPTDKNYTTKDDFDFYEYYGLSWQSMWEDNSDNKLKYIFLVRAKKNINEIDEMHVEMSDLAKQYAEKSESSHEFHSDILDMNFTIFLKEDMPHEVREDVLNNFKAIISTNGDSTEYIILDNSINIENNVWNYGNTYGK